MFKNYFILFYFILFPNFLFAKEASLAEKINCYKKITGFSNGIGEKDILEGLDYLLIPDREIPMTNQSPSISNAQYFKKFSIFTNDGRILNCPFGTIDEAIGSGEGNRYYNLEIENLDNSFPKKSLFMQYEQPEPNKNHNNRTQYIFAASKNSRKLKTNVSEEDIKSLIDKKYSKIKCKPESDNTVLVKLENDLKNIVKQVDCRGNEDCEKALTVCGKLEFLQSIIILKKPADALSKQPGKTVGG